MLIDALKSVDTLLLNSVYLPIQWVESFLTPTLKSVDLWVFMVKIWRKKEIRCLGIKWIRI